MAAKAIDTQCCWFFNLIESLHYNEDTTELHNYDICNHAKFILFMGLFRQITLYLRIKKLGSKD